MHLRKKILSVVLAGAMIGGELVTGIGSFTLPVNAADSSFAGEEWYDQIDKVEENREPAHAYFTPYESAEKALTNEKSVLDKDASESAYKQSLNGTWKFKFAQKPADREKQAKGADAKNYVENWDTSGWDDIKVPSSIQTIKDADGNFKYEKPIYVNQRYPWQNYENVSLGANVTAPTVNNSVGQYKRTFTVPSDWDGRDVFVSFEGVESAFYLYVNGQRVGYGEDSYTTDEFNITSYLKKGENTIAVEVYRWSTGSYLENQDFIRMSGIFRDVNLYSKAKVEMRDLFVKTELDDKYKDATLTLDADINHLELDTESTVSTTANASVYRMTASKPASVTGYGTIYQAEIKSSGVSFASSVRVSGYTIANGVTATAGGQTLTGSVTAAVSPESIAVDLNNLSALGKNVAVTVPNGLKIEKIESNGAVLAAGTDYTQTSTGAAISADWLGRLSRGSYKLTLTLSDGKTTAIAIAVTDSSVSENVQNASFDRYYKSEKYADVHARLSGANTSEDIWDVVLGLSSIDYTFDSSTRSLILPRGVLAQLRAGSYTISVELKNGKTEAFTLTVIDSAPTGESWAVEEYNTFSPSEPKFTLPLTRTSVRTVTVQNNGVTEALNAGSDYTISGQTLTLKKSALERYRKDGTAVVFSADLADGTAYALVIDYVKRK